MKLPLWCGCLLFLSLLPPTVSSAESWPSALDQMPMRISAVVLNKTNIVGAMLGAFQSNTVVKAIVFMPGATDDLYFFSRVIRLTNTSPTLLDTVVALTNQTEVRARFAASRLLLFTAADPLEGSRLIVNHVPTAERLKQKTFSAGPVFNDRNWQALHRTLTRCLAVKIKPGMGDPKSWHFYRASFAGFDLTGWEAAELTALATQTEFAIDRNCLNAHLLNRRR
jgi:hypothetical protein